MARSKNRTRSNTSTSLTDEENMSTDNQLDDSTDDSAVDETEQSSETKTEETAAPKSTDKVETVDETKTADLVAPSDAKTKTEEATPDVKVDDDGIEIMSLPIPKKKAGSSPSVISAPAKPHQVIPLNVITLNELIRRRHDVDLNTVTGQVKEIIDFLDRYETTMAVDVDIDVGESLQKQLYKTYLRIFILPNAADIAVCMDVLLWKFFKDKRGSFRVTQLGRYTRNGRWIIQELNMFLQLNHIFGAIKNPKDRIEKLRMFKLAAIVSVFPGDKVRYTSGFLSWTTALR